MEDALTISGVLVKHERTTGLDLGLQDSVPELLSLDSLPCTTFALVLLVEGLELLAPDLMETRCFVGAEEGPFATGFNSLHEQIGDPKRIEEITGSNFLLAMILAQVDELKDVGVPRLEINSKRTRALVTTLVDVSRRRVVHTEHGNNAVGVTVGARNVRTS